MNVRPIIFSGGMVSALLAGRKSQTRRLATSPLAKCQPGDLLYVREAFCPCWSAQPIYRADDPSGRGAREAGYAAEPKYKPSIHMPRAASRLTLEVTEVRREFLQTISDEHALAEGIAGITKDGKLIKYGLPDRDGLPGTDDYGWPWDQWQLTPSHAFKRVWASLHGQEGWDADPLVVALAFVVHRQNVDAFLARRAAA